MKVIVIRKTWLSVHTSVPCGLGGLYYDVTEWLCGTATAQRHDVDELKVR